MQRVVRSIVGLVVAAVCAPAFGAERRHDDAVTRAGRAPLKVLRGHFVPGEQPDGNSVVIDAPAGLIVVDSGRHAAHTDRIVAEAAARGRPIAVVVNTHWHLDHVSGNPRLRAAFPALVVYGSSAIEDAMDGFLARYRADLATRAAAVDGVERTRVDAEIARIDAGTALFPDHRVARTAIIALAGRRVTLGYAARAATEGDVWLHDAASRTLVAGDLVTLPAPFLDTACPDGWRAALDTLAELPVDRVVPGHGRVLTRDELLDYRRAFGVLLDCAASDADAATCVEGWRAGVDALLSDTERKQVTPLTSYYVTQVLRGDRMRIDAACSR